MTGWQDLGFRSRTMAPNNCYIGLPSISPYPPSHDEDSIMRYIDDHSEDIVRYQYLPWRKGPRNKRKWEPSDIQCPEDVQEASELVPTDLPSNLPYRQRRRDPEPLPNLQFTTRPANISNTNPYSNEESSTEHESDSESEANVPFVPKFVTCRGNEYFCDIDEDYLTDRFNLTGLNADVENYQHAIDLINDVFDADCDDDTRERIEKSARHLYGLIHARYITTTRGLQKMVRTGALWLITISSQCFSCPLSLTPSPPARKIQKIRFRPLPPPSLRFPPPPPHSHD